MEKNISCLLVDDDPDDQEIFIMTLSEIDKRIVCTCSYDGIKALALLQSYMTFVPDFIFLDINMPRMNGLVCLEELRKIDRLNKTEIVMYSTTADRRLEERSKAIGANQFLIKPTGIETMKTKLREIFLRHTG